MVLLKSKVRAKLWDNASDQVSSRIDNLCQYQVRTNLSSLVWNQLHHQVIDQVRNKINEI